MVWLVADQFRKQVLNCVRLKWPIIVVNGSGGCATEVASAVQIEDKRTTFIRDPNLFEIVQEGNIEACSSPPWGDICTVVWFARWRRRW